MFRHKGVHHKCNWHQDTLGRGSIMDFFSCISLSVAWPYFLVTQVKRGTELSQPGGGLDPVVGEDTG